MNGSESDFKYFIVFQVVIDVGAGSGKRLGCFSSLLCYKYCCGCLLIELGGSWVTARSSFLQGILSFFAVQAGARKVYAIEASSMATHCKVILFSSSMQPCIKLTANSRVWILKCCSLLNFSDSCWKQWSLTEDHSCPWKSWGGRVTMPGIFNVLYKFQSFIVYTVYAAEPFSYELD